EQVADERNVLLDLPHPPHAGLDLRYDLGLAVDLFDSEICAQLLDDRQERHRTSEGDAASFDEGGFFTGLGESTAKLVDETRLPDARLAGQENDVSATALRLSEQILELGELALTADQRRETSFRRDVDAGLPAARAKNLVRADECLVPLDAQLPEVTRLEEAVDRAMCKFRDQDRSRRAKRLEPRSDVGRIALGRVVHPQVVADSPDDDGAGVQPDAHP